MNQGALHDRFEELEAGRVLGDLDADEQREWQELRDSLGTEPDLTLELVAAAVETEFLLERDEPLPEVLLAQLRTDTAEFVVDPAGRDDGKIVSFGLWRRVLRAPQTGWAIAAVLAVLLVANFLATRGSDTPPTGGGLADGPTTKPTQLVSAEARETLAREASDLLEAPFAGLPGYDEVTGELIWSDERQEGYMTLTNLPANDPAKNQYQLWIVDPDRDDEPVDGGVFDMLPGQDTALIPIRTPPVSVSNPVVFLITLEKPGGVVVSDQEVKVALAKPT